MSEPLRILLVTKSTGGVAEYVFRLVKGLDGKQFKLSVACLSENGPLFARQLSQIPGVSAFSMAMDRYRIDPLSDTRLLLALAAHLRKERYDLVHAHASKPGFITRLAAIGTGIPVLYSPHCFAFHAGSKRVNALVVAFLERLAARFLTARIVTIASGEQELARQYHVGTDALFTTIHTGIDTHPFHTEVDLVDLKKSLDTPADARVVGAIGRLSPQKSPLDFVRMASIIRKARTDVHFIWIGSGELLETAVQLGNDLGLAGVLHFTGHRSDTPALLQLMDCFVLSSIWEGFPMVLLEAMAAAIPIVATDIPGSNEAIRSGLDGWLVPAQHPEALAGSVLDVMSNPELASNFRKNARLRVEQEFTPRKMFDGMADLYLQVGNKHRKMQVQSISRSAGL